MKTIVESPVSGRVTSISGGYRCSNKIQIESGESYHEFDGLESLWVKVGQEVTYGDQLGRCAENFSYSVTQL